MRKFPFSNVSMDFESVANWPRVSNPVAAYSYAPQYLNYASHSEKVIAFSKLQAIRELKENWDGMGAAAIDVDAASQAVQHLAKLMGVAPVPDLVPNQNGTISFTWESERGSAQLEIGRTKTSFYLRPEVGEKKFGDGKSSEIQIRIAEIVASVLFPKEMTENSLKISVE